MTILSELTAPSPTPAGFWEFWLTLAFLAGVAVNVVTLIVLLSGRKERREISWAFEPASKEDFEAHKAAFEAQREHCASRNSQIFKSIETTNARIDAAIKETQRHLEGKIDETRERIEDRMDTRFCELAKSDNEGRDKMQHRLDQLTLAVGRICGRLNIRPGEPEI